MLFFQYLCSLLISLKISMFYWRIVDQHSFPLDVSEFPKLAVIGAYSSSEIYTPADVQDIISYMLNIFLLTELTIKTGYGCAGWYESHLLRPLPASRQQDSFASPPKPSPISQPTLFHLLPRWSHLMCSALAATSCATHRTTQTQTELRSSGKTFDQALDVFLQAEHAVLRKMGKTPMVKAGRFPNIDLVIGYVTNFVLKM